MPYMIGCCSAVIETVFLTIKAELISRSPWETRRQAATAIFQHISDFITRAADVQHWVEKATWHSNAKWPNGTWGGTKACQEQFLVKGQDANPIFYVSRFALNSRCSTALSCLHHGFQCLDCNLPKV
jgi:hypothetical protein